MRTEVDNATKLDCIKCLLTCDNIALVAVSSLMDLRGVCETLTLDASSVDMALCLTNFAAKHHLSTVRVCRHGDILSLETPAHILLPDDAIETCDCDAPSNKRGATVPAESDNKRQCGAEAEFYGADWRANLAPLIALASIGGLSLTVVDKLGPGGGHSSVLLSDPMLLSAAKLFMIATRRNEIALDICMDRGIVCVGTGEDFIARRLCK